MLCKSVAYLTGAVCPMSMCLGVKFHLSVLSSCQIITYNLEHNVWDISDTMLIFGYCTRTFLSCNYSCLEGNDFTNKGNGDNNNELYCAFTCPS